MSSNKEFEELWELSPVAAENCANGQEKLWATWGIKRLVEGKRRIDNKAGSIVDWASNVNNTRSRKKSMGGNAWKSVCGRACSLCLTAGVLLFCSLPALGQSEGQAQSQPPPQSPSQQSGNAQGTPPTPDQVPAQQLAGTISGTVVDRTGALVAGAFVKLTQEDSSLSQETMSDSDGQFYFAGIPPGPFKLTVTSPGFTTQASSGTLHSGEDYIVPPIELLLATAVSEVRVSLSPKEEAEAEIKDEEKQ